MIEVVNVRDTEDNTYEYVGRTKKFGDSSLGNPYELYKDGNREEVVALYRPWLWEQIKNQSSLQYLELTKLKEKALSGDLKLGCHCFPKKCHADVVKRAIEWMIKG
jgi:hypothetical protein